MRYIKDRVLNFAVRLCSPQFTFVAPSSLFAAHRQPRRLSAFLNFPIDLLALVCEIKELCAGRPARSRRCESVAMFCRQTP